MAAVLFAALRPEDRALWGCAFYAGLRRGELRALEWHDVEPADGLIRVERSMSGSATARPADQRAAPAVAASRSSPPCTISSSSTSSSRDETLASSSARARRSLGHASIQTTFDLYGHLMPGNEDEAVALVDAYLARASSEKRLAQID